LACSVGVKRRGSRIEILLSVSTIQDRRDHWTYLSSFVTSLEFLRFFSPDGRGGGDEDGPGETDFWRDDRLEPREGVLYGVSVGVGREAAAAAAYSSSVSHAPAIVKMRVRTSPPEWCVNFPLSTRHQLRTPEDAVGIVRRCQWLIRCCNDNPRRLVLGPDFPQLCLLKLGWGLEWAF